jgi:lysophospholipase L1-like esterase
MSRVTATRTRARFAGIAMGTCSVLFCLSLLELFSMWFYGRPGMHYGMEMWKYAKYVKVRSEKPERAHQHRPNAKAFLMGVDVTINALGLRDREMPLAKPAGTYRILVLGDSITLGWGVPFDQLFTKQLEKSLNANPPSPRYRNYEVINTGVGNYNTAQETAYFKEQGLRFNPDMVLVAWFINDAEPTPVPSRNWLAYHSYAYVGITSNFGALLRYTSASQNYRNYYESLYAANQSGWLKSQAAFAELSSLCKSRNIHLRILLIPELHTLGGNYEFTRIHDLIRGVGSKLDVPVLDLLDAFSAAENPHTFWVSPGDAHPNGRANELMAAKIDAALRSEKWWH